MALGLGFKESGYDMTSLVRRALIAAALTALGCGLAAQGLSRDKVQTAGPAPSEASINAAIGKYMRGKDNSFDNRKPFKVLSGPTLATGETFAGNLEQAWLMCVVVNAIKTQPGPADIEGKSLYLRRNAAGDVVVVPIENWKNSSPQCGGVN